MMTKAGHVHTKIKITQLDSDARHYSPAKEQGKLGFPAGDVGRSIKYQPLIESYIIPL
jgi:hypothetical protein